MIDYEIDRISHITLMNPQQHNALRIEDFLALEEALDKMAKYGSRALIITGQGKSFCSGVDFSALRVGDWVNDNPLSKLCYQIEHMPMPVIAALNGHCIGGGVEIAMSCDFRIGIKEMKMRVPAANIAVHYEPSGMARIARIIGWQMTRRLFLRAETFSGEALLSHGFLDEISDEPLNHAIKWAEDIAKLAPNSVEGMKISLNALSAGQSDPHARTRIEQAFASTDHAEALNALNEKRPPIFGKD